MRCTWSKVDDAKLFNGGAKKSIEVDSSGQVDVNTLVVPEYQRPQLGQIEDYLFLKVIALSDCANIFTAVANWQPMPVDKLTAISLSFIRGVAHGITFSFLDAAFNVADTITKQGSN